MNVSWEWMTATTTQCAWILMEVTTVVVILAILRNYLESLAVSENGRIHDKFISALPLLRLY